MISANGNDYITLQDEFFVNGKKVLAAYANGAQVYPRKGSTILKAYGELKRSYTKSFPDIQFDAGSHNYGDFDFIPAYSFPYNVDLRFCFVYVFNNPMSESIQKEKNGYWPVSNPEALRPQYWKRYNRLEKVTVASTHEELLYPYCNNPDYLDDVRYDSIHVDDSVQPMVSMSKCGFKFTASPFTLIPEYRARRHYYSSDTQKMEYKETTYRASSASVDRVCALNGNYYTFDNSVEMENIDGTYINAVCISQNQSGSWTAPARVPQALRIDMTSPTATNRHLVSSYSVEEFDSADQSTIIKDSLPGLIVFNTIAVAPVTKILYLGDYATAPEWAKNVYESDLE